MCLEDIRLGRDLGHRVIRVQTVLNTTGLLIAANPRRTRLLVSPGGNFNLMIGTADKPPTTTAGVFLASQNQPILLTVEEWGKWLTEDIQINDIGNAQIVTVIEWELGKE